MESKLTETQHHLARRSSTLRWDRQQGIVALRGRLEADNKRVLSQRVRNQLDEKEQSGMK